MGGGIGFRNKRYIYSVDGAVIGYHVLTPTFLICRDKFCTFEVILKQVCIQQDLWYTARTIIILILLTDVHKWVYISWRWWCRVRCFHILFHIREHVLSRNEWMPHFYNPSLVVAVDLLHNEKSKSFGSHYKFRGAVWSMNTAVTQWSALIRGNCLISNVLIPHRGSLIAHKWWCLRGRFRVCVPSWKYLGYGALPAQGGKKTKRRREGLSGSLPTRGAP